MTLKINHDFLTQLADLAMLKIASEDIEQYQKSMEQFLNLVQDLEKVQTENIVPLYNLSREQIEQDSSTRHYRQDYIKESISLEAILKNATEVKMNQFKVNTLTEIVQKDLQEGLT
jgi:aspartyl/glutamyl-tRNA(Asn/Gln) amidotransferase C subunit